MTGDGRSTVRELIERENADRRRVGVQAGQDFVHVDIELRQTLRAHGLDVKSVPAAGETVVLKTVVNDNRGRDNVAAADRLCDAVVAAGARAAEALRVRLAGVDIITPDPGLPLEEAHGVIVEVNTTPGYYFHHMASGGAVPVARLILERLCSAQTAAVTI